MSKLDEKRKIDKEKREEIIEFFEKKGWDIERSWDEFIRLEAPDKSKRVILEKGVLYVMDFKRRKEGAKVLSILVAETTVTTNSLRANYIELHF